ncbi:MAG: histidinol-phosphatase, partial [Lutispora sp.]|nr:histidinol-phosphatase [Lutispora sp.]
LSLFDFVIASVHSGLNMEKEKITSRIINAIKNKHTTMIGHMTGRILLAREPSDMDVYEVLDAAADNRKIIEINSDPHRLDLDWRYIKYAKTKEIKFAINPDAHNIEGLKNIMLGIGIARKGWLEKKDIINCMEQKEVGDYFEKQKR